MRPHGSHLLPESPPVNHANEDGAPPEYGPTRNFYDHNAP